MEWNKLGLNIRNSESLNISKKSLLKFKPSSGSSVFNFHNPRGVKLLTRLRRDLSHLPEHKFKHDTSSCGNDIKTSAHSLLHCPHYYNGKSN